MREAKIWALNLFSVGITFSHIHTALSFAATVAALAYSAWGLYDKYQDRKNRK